MKLDYSQGCVNFRDVGEWVNLILGRDFMATGRIYRGGKISTIDSLDEINNPKTIVNLRNGDDPYSFMRSTDYYHFPTANNLEKYFTKKPEVRKWLRRIFDTLEKNNLSYPIFFHCTSGKDRTGVVIAVLLLLLGVPQEVIIEEYLLSDGEVKEEWIMEALNGVGDMKKYFTGVDIEVLKNKFLI